LNGEQTTVREMCAEFRRRHDVVLAGLNKIPGFRCSPADGTFYLFPNVEAAMQIKHAATDVELCERLLDGAGVALVPGTAFGAPGHVRLSFAASLETLGEALARLEKFMAT
jgi:aspartate aminotransferase